MRTLFLLLLLTLPAAAVTLTLAWEDANPAGVVTKFTLYRKTWTSPTTSVWQKVKDIPAGTLTTTVEMDPSLSNVYAMSCWAGVLESAKAELAVEGPKIPVNFTAKP